MPRFENATHFWEIERAGAANTVTTGKHGNKGRRSTRHHASASAAQTEHDRLVREKLRAGYKPVDVAPPTPAIASDPAEKRALEQRLALDPYDAHSFSVLGDLLLQEGHPRGELVALQLATEGQADDKRHFAAGKHIARHVETLLGPLAGLVEDVRLVDQPPFLWRFGFIHRAHLVDRQIEALGDLLQHPSGAVLAELAIVGDPLVVQRAMDVLASVAPPSLRELSLTVRGPIALGDLWPAVARLERLTVMAEELEVGRHFALPNAKRVSLLALRPNCEEIETVARAPWPALERLELRLSTTRLASDGPAFEDVQPLLVRDDMPALSQLRLRRATFAGAIIRALVKAPFAPQLELVDLSHGDMSPGDAAALAASAPRFTKLRELWLPMRHLRPQDREALMHLAKHVIDDGRAPLDRLEELISPVRRTAPPPPRQ